MGETIIAVAGTLPGGTLTALFQSRSTRADRKAARADRRADDLRAALGALVAAIGDHRRTMWHREHLRLTAAPQQTVDTARSASHTTRSAVTAPLVAVSVLEPGLAATARAAAMSAFEMRGAADLDLLAAQREHSITATNDLVAAGRVLRQGD